MEATSRHHRAAKRLRPVFIGVTTLLVVLLGAFAYLLAHSQSQQRRDAERRFSNRAEVAASVNESLFTLAATQTAATDRALFGAATLSSQALARRIVQTRAAYELILDTNGRVLAQSGSVVSGTGRAGLVAKAIQRRTTEYSGVLAGPGGTPIIESATPFVTRFGTRVDVTGGDARPLASYLDGFLGRLAVVAHARSYVIDPSERLIAAPGVKIRPGAKLADPGLAAVSASETHGAYDGGRYFASAPISGTPWRIVLTAARNDLYSGINTTIPWIIFGAFVVMSAVGLFLVRRVLLANAELQRAELSRVHALEINDNVVQRLVLAKYALDRGATETSQQKVAETLRETQQLVTTLLEDQEIAPGALRRQRPAATDGLPEPPARSWQGR